MKWPDKARALNVFLLFLCIGLSLPVWAQQPPAQTGNWLMYFGLNRLSDNFSIHSEVQYRNHTLAPVTPEQLMLRTGVNYHFDPNAFATAGYAYIPSYFYESEKSAPEIEEHRVWQQLLMNNFLGRVKFEHRYRVEQRWINRDYRNRLRYRLMAFIPLNKPSMQPKTIFLGLYDEIFLNTVSSYFDRNRLYGALGYQFNASTQVQAGLLHQQAGDFGKYYLQFALVFNPDFREG